MKRLTIYAHYDAQRQLKRYVEHTLAALRPLSDRLVFVSTAALDQAAQDRAANHADEVRLQPNRGFDFGMWKAVIEATDLSAYDELVLSNSSVVGPLWPLGPFFERMAAAPCDFWGMTDNCELDWHLQSYFLVFKRPVLAHPAFHELWATVLPYRDKFQVIRSYEVGLTRYLTEAGLRGQAAVPLAELFPPGRLGLLFRYKKRNATCYYPERLLDRGMPFVKLQLIRDNPIGVPLGPVMRRIRASGFDTTLFEIDRPASGEPVLGDRFFRYLQRPIAALVDRFTGRHP